MVWGRNPPFPITAKGATPKTAKVETPPPQALLSELAEVLSSSLCVRKSTPLQTPKNTWLFVFAKYKNGFADIFVK